MGIYLLESLQIYFPASLELQKELIKHGYKVPKPTPIPIVYANSKGWISDPPPITIERLIDPARYGKTPEELGWLPTPPLRGKQAFKLPYEESYLVVEVKDGEVLLSIKVKKYHIERPSIRGVNPEKWKNWVGLYLSIDDLMAIADELHALAPSGGEFYVAHERLPGPEDTYYVYKATEYKRFGLPIVKHFSLCPGCFDYIRAYLNREPHERIVNNLRIERDPLVPSYLKVGIAKVEGKSPQFMLKLASSSPIKIQGLLKPIIEGKARGKLTFCDHLKPEHWILIDGIIFRKALGFWKHALDTRSFRLARNPLMKFPAWLS